MKQSALVARLFCTAFGLWSAGAIACTTFLLPEAKERVMGKSYDWHQAQGIAFVNKRNVAKKAFTIDPRLKPAEWTSKYGSLTFNQYGREMPLGGINEAGLAVEIMWLDETQYQKPGSDPTVNELQWIQYQLDRFTTVDEVVKNAGSPKVAHVYGKVHYMACDFSGACATVEFLDGKPVVHAGEAMVVNTLANDTYDKSTKALKKYQGFGGNLPAPIGMGSISRFVRASFRTKAFDPLNGVSPLAYAFDTLKSVSDGGTKWNVVYEIALGRAHFQTSTSPKRRSMDARAFDYSCKLDAKMLDMTEGPEGEVTEKFVDYEKGSNEALIKASFKSIQHLLPEGALKALAAYPETLQCME